MGSLVTEMVPCGLFVGHFWSVTSVEALPVHTGFDDRDGGPCLVQGHRCVSENWLLYFLINKFLPLHYLFFIII